MPQQDSWRPLSLDSSLRQAAGETVAAPLLAKLGSLPFGEQTWEDFERLQWRIMQDVEGLRYAQVYGERGQSQYGLDIVALAPDGSGVALQSKRYKRFGPAELKAAVKKFHTTKRPFEIDRLIISVSREIKSTGVVETLAELRRAHKPLILDLWDGQELSRLLRPAPAVVVEFFGIPTAQAFCLPFELAPTTIPSVDAVAVREALARTPDMTTGASQLLEQARTVQDPTAALRLVEEAQVRLRDAGFSGHAALHEPRRTELLAKLGRADDAARRILDELWAALDQGLTGTAQVVRQRLMAVTTNKADGARVTSLIKAANVAFNLYFNPLAHLPAVESLAVGDDSDTIRLAVLAGEIALANDDLEWLRDGQEVLTAYAQKPTDNLCLVTRLRLLIAEASGGWADLLEDARKVRLGYDLLGLVTARYARHCAIHQRFEEADVFWDEAAGAASLASRWIDASTWIFSRRAFRARWKPFTGSELLPMQIAVRQMGPALPIITIDQSALQDALNELHRRKLRAAAIAAQRALRDAVSTSNWAGEIQARQVVAAILVESGEPQAAARQLIRAGDVSGLKDLAKTSETQFIDVVADLDSLNYWTVGSAYRLLAAQADLIPGDLVDPIAIRIVEELAAAEEGRVADLRVMNTSRYGGAISALAGMSERLSQEHAAAVLAHFERQPPVEPNHYRYHDEDEAVTTARVVLAHEDLRSSGTAHLVALLARSQSARNSTTAKAVDQNINTARPYLSAVVGEGHEWAQEVLAFHDPQAVPPEATRGALERLTTPLVHVPGVLTSGTRAIGDSLLVLGQSAALLEPAISELLTRAEDPHVGSSDRIDYLLAAANIAPHLKNADRRKHFATAMRCADSPTSSMQDDFESGFGHALGAMRIQHSDQDSRDPAVYLAACLATSAKQQADTRIRAFALLGGGRKSDYWPTRALQKLGSVLKEDLGYLTAQGWALRSLAAIVWATDGETQYIGLRLAQDPDVRVRQALAKALADQPARDYQATARKQLERDPAFSVRRHLKSRERDKSTDTPVPET
ncbi:hypothetical protein [Kribbella lupini]|uniref:HEAT repeat protein n=1 Tax=Kribbella lupini TaxID=291602 RepID=A0ABP4NHN4_9ACTN